MTYRTFISTILATAVAITGLTAAPVRAGDDDIIKLLAGVAAVAIIGSAIANSRDDDDHIVSRHDSHGKRHMPHHRNHGRVHQNHGNHKHGHVSRHHTNGFRGDSNRFPGPAGRDHNGYAKPLPHRVQRKLLPGGCRVQARTRTGGTFNAYSNGCLQKNYRYAGSLPAQCAVNAKTRNGGKRNTVYGSRCLRGYGYRLAHR